MEGALRTTGGGAGGGSRGDQRNAPTDRAFPRQVGGA